MARLTEISRDSELVINATKCYKIPKKHLDDFFSELVKQRGVKMAYAFIEEGNGILAEAFNWNASVKGGEFWSNLENKMLAKAGMIVETVSMEDKCTEKLNNIRDKRSEELAAIHADMKELLEILRKV